MARLRFDQAFVRCSLRLTAVADLATAVERCRRLLDLDADPVIIDRALASDSTLAPLVAARPGLRSPGSVDGFETAVFAVLGQQISVLAACGLAARLVRSHGALVEPDGELRAFPEPGAIADAELADLGMTNRTREAVRQLAVLCADEVIFDPGADRSEVRAKLLEVRGIGPWTADYIALRSLRDPDVLPTGDLIVRRSAQALGLPNEAAVLATHGIRWSPWRTYVTQHLWAASSGAAPLPIDPKTGVTHD